MPRRLYVPKPHLKAAIANVNDPSINGFLAETLMESGQDGRKLLLPGFW